LAISIVLYLKKKKSFYTFEQNVINNALIKLTMK